MKITDKITNPCDSTEYKLYGFKYADNLKVTLKQKGGSFEKINHKVVDGVLIINTPVWAKNPSEIIVKLKQ